MPFLPPAKYKIKVLATVFDAIEKHLNKDEGPFVLSTPGTVAAGSSQGVTINHGIQALDPTSARAFGAMTAGLRLTWFVSNITSTQITVVFGNPGASAQAGTVELWIRKF